MTGSELILRLDPPPNSVNPHRLDGASSTAHAGNMETVQASQSNSLHPESYVTDHNCGEPSVSLDRLGWPAWETLRPANLIPVTNLTVFTAHSFDFNEFIDFGDEDMEGANDEQTDGMIEPAPTPESLNPDDYSFMPQIQETVGPAWYDSGRVNS
jgi:hypothetical protein